MRSLWQGTQFKIPILALLVDISPRLDKSHYILTRVHCNYLKNNKIFLNLCPSISTWDKRKNSLLWKQKRNSSGIRVSIWDKDKPPLNSPLAAASLHSCAQVRPGHRDVDVPHQKPDLSYSEGLSLVSPTPCVPHLQNRDRGSCPSPASVGVRSCPAFTCCCYLSSTQSSQEVCTSDFKECIH